MGTVNVLKGLDTERKIYKFNGTLRKNLALDWEHCKIYLGSQELDSQYEVREDDVVIIREHPGLSAAAVAIIAFVSLAAAVTTGAISIYKAKQAQREAKEAMDKLRNQMKKNGETETIPWLAGARNQKAEGKQSPIILGRHLFTPYYLCDPYMVPSGKDGEDLDWYGTFLVGQSGLAIEELRNGTTHLAGFAGEKETVVNRQQFTGMGGTEGFASIVQRGYFPTDIFNQKWTDSLESTVEIGRKKDSGEKTYEEYIAGGGTGGSNGYQAWLTNYREQKRLAEEDGIHVYDEGPEEIIRQTASFPMKAEIEIYVDGLSGWDSQNGVATDATVEIELGWSKNESGPWTKIPITGWADGTHGTKTKLTKNSQKQMRFLASVDFSTYASTIYDRKGTPVYIRAVRHTRMHVNGYKDRVYLSAIRTRQYNPKESDDKKLVPAKNISLAMAGKFCRMGIQLRVNKNTEENLDRFNVIASMTGRVWDKATKKWSTDKAKTSNPAAVALEVLTGLIHNASALGDDEIDLPSFGRLHEYCQGREVEVEGEPKVAFNLECNGVLSSPAKKIDVLKEVLATCDAGLYVNEFGKAIAYYDDYQETPIALLNPQNIVTMNETRNFDHRAEGYLVEFVNAEADWSTDTHKILRPFVEEPEGGCKYSPVKFIHVTGYYHAMWLARRMMAKEVHRPGEVKVSVGKEGRYFAPGSLLKVQHEGFKHGIGSGEIVNNIVEGNQIIGIRTMEKFNLSKDRDYFVDWYVVDDERNHVVTRQIQSPGEYTNILLFTTPQPMNWEAPIPANSDDAPIYGNIVSVIDNEREGTVKVRESKRYLVSDLSETEQGYDLTLVQYNENIYETGKINPYVSSIIKSNPLVLSSHVDTRPYDGANGRGVRSINYKYRLTATNAKPTQGWSNTGWLETMPIPTSTNKYLWFIERILYTDGSFTDTIGLQAVYGDKGEAADIGTIWQETYWGATTTAPNNTGTHDGRKINHGNYLMYKGQTSGTWEYAYIYQWDAINKTWAKLPRANNWEKYLDGVSDLTAGTPEGIFSTAFMKTLFAQTLNGDYANIRMELRVGTGDDVIVIDGVNKQIYTKGFTGIDGSVKGFRFKAYDQATGGGLIEVNNIKTKNMVATNGMFEGELTAGALQANTKPLYSTQRRHTSGKNIPTVMEDERSFLNITNDPLAGYSISGRIEGTYGSRSLEEIYIYVPGRVGGLTLDFILYYADGTNSGNLYMDGQSSLTATLSFRYRTKDWTVAITDISDNDPRISGVLYREGNKLMISTG
jgi:hypothetical protein